MLKALIPPILISVVRRFRSAQTPPSRSSPLFNSYQQASDSCDAKGYQPAARLSGGGLKFFSDVDQAAAHLGVVDLVFTSGALQYTPDPLGILAKLIAVNAKHLFITQTTFNEGDDAVISVQSSMLSSNGPGALPAGFRDHEISYPITFASKKKAEQILHECYEIRFFIDEEKGAYSVQGRPFHMYGYFCDLK